MKLIRMQNDVNLFFQRFKKMSNPMLASKTLIVLPFGLAGHALTSNLIGLSCFCLQKSYKEYCEDISRIFHKAVSCLSKAFESLTKSHRARIHYPSNCSQTRL